MTYLVGSGEAVVMGEYNVPSISKLAVIITAVSTITC